MTIAHPIGTPIAYLTSVANPRRIPRTDPNRTDPLLFFGSQVQIVKAVEGRRLDGLVL